MKTCSCCGVVKPMSEFCNNRCKPDGKHHYCKPCDSLRKKKRRAQKRLVLVDEYSMKRCCGCGIEKQLMQFHNSPETADGKTGKCKVCRLEERRLNHQNNLERDRQRNKEYIKQQRELYPDKHKELARNWRDDNRSRYRHQARKSAAKYPERCLKHAALRAKRVRQRTPLWADKEAIVDIYRDAKWLTEQTGIQFHVDHIVPLNGKMISGLHVHENLQILTASENCIKSNSFGEQ